MFVVGLTGGIGSGKSTFAALLAERGAHVIDADELGRDALRPGQPAWHSVVNQFGRQVLAAGSMEIDRVRLAEIVFSDRERLAALNAIVHPPIVAGIAAELERLSGSDAIVVLDAALIVDLKLDDALDALIVVDADPAVRRDRLVRSRGMSLADIGARMAAQLSADELAKRADIVVTNDSDLAALAGQADRVWRQLLEMASLSP